MPADFDKCRRAGGKIRAKRINSKEYMHICVKGGKSYAGYPKQYQKLTKKKAYVYKEDKKMHSYGDIDDEKKVIRVNPAKGDVIDTILHEELHKNNPGMNEKQVSKKATLLQKKMSIKNQRNLLSNFLRKKKNANKV